MNQAGKKPRKCWFIMNKEYSYRRNNTSDNICKINGKGAGK